MSTRPMIFVAGTKSKQTISDLILDNQEPHETTTLHLDNKYYSADIDVVVAADLHENAVHFFEEHIGSIKALVLVFDSNISNSFQSIVRWQHVLKEHGDSLDATICAAVNSTFERDEYSHESWSINPSNWCIEQQVELVRVNPQLRAVDPEKTDGECIPRIVEAFHSVMWPNMEMKQNRSTPAEAENSTNPHAEDESVPQADDTPNVMPLDGNETGAADLQNAKATVSMTSNQSEVVSENTGSEIDGDSLIKSLLSSVASEEQSDDLDDLQQLFEQIMQVRKESSSLSDQERRKRAEDMMTKVFAALG